MGDNQKVRRRRRARVAPVYSSRVVEVPQVPHVCVALRHSTKDMSVSVNLAGLLGGCSCSCHHLSDGAQIANEVWARMYGGEL